MPSVDAGVASVGATLGIVGQAPTAMPLWGSSVGDHNGWTAVSNWASWVESPPEIIRIYPAGGIPSGVPPQLVKVRDDYPNSSVVFGPRSVDGGWTNTQRDAMCAEMDEILTDTGYVEICPNPEFDRYIRNSAYTQSDIDDDFEAWFDFLTSDWPHLLPYLNANIVGYDLHNNGRLNTYVDPLLPFIQGVAVNAYTFSPDGVSGRSGAEGPQSMEEAASYAVANDLWVSYSECGCEDGANQDTQYAEHAQIAVDAEARSYIVWNTSKDGGGTGGADLDCGLNADSRSFWADWIATH